MRKMRLGLKAALRSIDSLLPRSLSYRARRLVGHTSASVSLATFIQQKTPRVPFPEEELMERGAIVEFLEAAERRLGSDESDPLFAVAFARACNKVGAPERLLNAIRENLISRDIQLIPTFRRHTFTALIASGALDQATLFARESIAMGAYDRLTLLLMLADAKLLADPTLVTAIANRFLALRIQPTVHELVFLQNTVLSYRGIDGLMALPLWSKPVRSDQDGSLLRSNIAMALGNYRDQLSYFNSALEKNDLRPIELIDDTRPLSVNNLRTARQGVVRGPLVTVAMSTFNSSATVIAALRALSEQDYQDLDIVVIDDCSTDDTVERVRNYSLLDPRVRLILPSSNGGTYRARNLALQEARGEYFTVNDSDDCSHPQKMTSLVSALEAAPGAVAAQSMLVRLSATFGCKPKLDGYVHRDQSSLLFRRSAVLERLGYYHEVRVGADSEFSERVTAAFGPQAIETIVKPLLIADWSPTSASGALSTGITDGGVMAPARNRFKLQYRARHRSGEDIYVPFRESVVQ